MVTKNVKYINTEPRYTDESRECLDFLQDLPVEKLERLRGILLKASLESLGTYYAERYFSNTKTIGVYVEELEELFGVDSGYLRTSYVYGKAEEDEGNLVFFHPIGMILESVLPNDLTVLEERSVNYVGDDVQVVFKVIQNKQ
jgi:hypothetical protein